MRLPKSPEDRRKTRNARQARYRASQKAKETLNAHIDHSAGVGPRPRAPMPPVSSADLATAVRDRMLAIVNEMDDEDLLNKDFAAAIANGLKAQNTLDGREKLKAKTGQTLELLAGLRAILSGDLPGPPRQLEDGNTVEGAFTDVSTD